MFIIFSPLPAEFMNTPGYNDIKLPRKKGYISEENYWYVVKISIIINGIWTYIYVSKSRWKF